MLLLAAPPANAAAAADEDSGETITFVPAFAFVAGDPGETVRTTLTIKNQTRVDAAFTSELFDMAEEPGASRALEYLPIGEAPRGAGAWIKPLAPREFELEAGTERVLDVVVDIPADAEPGGWYGAVQVRASNPDAGEQVAVDALVPTPVFITVGSGFERDLDVRVDARDTWRWRGGSATWDVRLRNDGQVHEVYGGRVRLDTVLSGTPSVDLEPGVLLPGEERTIPVRVDLRSAPDLVRARVRVERDGADAAEASAERVVQLPAWLLVAALALVVVVAWRVRARRSRWSEDAFEG